MNPFAFPAQPIFKVYGDSGGVLYVGDESITIHSIKDYVLLKALSEELIKKLDERYGTADKLSAALLAKLDERYAPPICAQEAAPKNPKINALWVDSKALRLKLWDGEIWQTVGYEPPEPEPDPDTPTEGGGEEDGKQEGESSGTDSGGTGAGSTGD